MPGAPEKFPNAEKFTLYENGKHRRYELLFAVNGGAFTVATLFPGKDPNQLLGGLTFQALAWGLIIFTALMAFDIWIFGCRMRHAIELKDTSEWEGVFGVPGKFVLVGLSVLIGAGWFLVARGQ